MGRVCVIYGQSVCSFWVESASFMGRACVVLGRARFLAEWRLILTDYLHLILTVALISMDVSRLESSE